MKIFYIITILIIYILFLLMHKSEKKQNLIKWLCISSILILCYNILICLILTFMGLLCTLTNLSIINVITSILLLAVILKSKRTQKYYFKILDFSYCIIILVLVILIAYKQYGFPFNIKYEIVDGSIHYFFAQQFYENSTLLYNEATDDNLGIYNPNFRLPGAYTNQGIIFKLFDTVALKTDLFILFDLFILYLSGVLFYYLLQAYAGDNKKLKILAMIFSIMYMLGYQLNSMIRGHIYLSLALDIIITFLILIANHKKDNLSNQAYMPIISLISFGIFFSYAYFIPVIYIAILIDTIIKSKINKEKVISSQNILMLIYTILIPSILGIAYFIIMPVVSGMKTEISTIGTEGAIYENYISNYLAFIPIILINIIFLIKSKEKKENDYFQVILFISSIIFSIILFIGYKLQIVSRYYFFKSYYLIWLLAIYNTYLAISNNSINKIVKKIIYYYTAIYIIILIISTLIFQNNIFINDIWNNNLNNIKDENYILNHKEVKTIYEIENSSFADKSYILPPQSLGKMYWISTLLHNQHLYINYFTDYIFDINQWLESDDKQYYIAFYNDYEKNENFEIHLEDNSEKYEIIYNDENAFVLKRK